MLWGRGGRATTDAQIRSAGLATPDWRWKLVDPTSSARGVWRDLCQSTVVVTHAGQNAVAEVAAAGRPAVVVAQPRPHGEQLATAAAVDRLGVGVGLSSWPNARDWPAILDEATRRGGKWHLWQAGGASAAARLLEERLSQLRLAAA